MYVCSCVVSVLWSDMAYEVCYVPCRQYVYRGCLMSCCCNMCCVFYVFVVCNYVCVFYSVSVQTFC